MASELTACLHRLPDEVIVQIGSHYQCSERTTLCRALLQLAHVKPIWQGLNSLEREVFLSFLFASRSGVIEEREGEAWAQARRHSRLAWHRAITALRQRGFIYAFRNERYERLYVCPAEIRRLFASDLFLGQPIRWCDPYEVSSISEPSYGLGQALFHFLARMEHEPWPWTKAGNIPRRVAQRCDVELGLDSASLRLRPWSDQELPPWIAFLLALSRSLGLLAENERYLTVHPLRWRKWLEQDWEEMMAGLYWAVRQLVAQQLKGAEGDFLLLEAVEPRQWLPLSQWTAMKRSGYAEKGKELRESEERRDALLALLVGAGWLEEGRTKSGERCVRLTELPPWQSEAQVEMPVYIQPDLELIVPRHFPLSQRRMLAQMADFMGGEHLLFYLITEESLQRARHSGMTAAEILDKLALWSGQPVPEIVAKKIELEEKKVAAVYCDRILQYVLPPHFSCEQIEAKLSAWRATLLDDGRLLVPVEKERAVTEWFSSAGLEVIERSGSLTGLPEEPAVSQPRLVEPPFLHWQIEAELPRPGAELTGIKSLPKLWSSGLHAYRLPMKRELIQQGIRLGIKLKVEKDGEQQIVYPLTVEERVEGAWLIADQQGQRITLPLEQIDRVQLITV